MDTKSKNTIRIKLPDGNIYEGEFRYKMILFGEKIPHGKGMITYYEDNKVSKIYKGNIENGKPKKEGNYYIINNYNNNNKIDKYYYSYIQMYNKDGIMNKVKYKYEDTGKNIKKLVISYNEINKALNEGKIKEPKDLMEYIYDKNGKKLNDQEVELIGQCAKYQMQSKLKGPNGKLDDANRMDGGFNGLQNLIVLAKLSKNINALRRVRFRIEQNNPDYPANTYKNKEEFLNSFGLTTYDPPKNDNLIFIGTLIKNGIDYFSTNMETVSRNHGVSGIIDLKKIMQLVSKNNKRSKELPKEEELKELENFIYIYDSSRIADNGGLGGLQTNCLFYSHNQQRLGTCWYNAVCSTIIAAEYIEISEKIRRGEIKPIVKKIVYSSPNEIKFNDFEILQIMELSKVAKYLGVERFGQRMDYFLRPKDTQAPTMTYQIVNNEIKQVLKDHAARLTSLDYSLFSTHIALRLIAEERGLLKENSTDIEENENTETLTEENPNNKVENNPKTPKIEDLEEMANKINPKIPLSPIVMEELSERLNRKENQKMVEID